MFLLTFYVKNYASMYGTSLRYNEPFPIVIEGLGTTL